MKLFNIINNTIIRPNNCTSGFTFIEMMIALTLLATFGTSLFLVQNNILSKVFHTHRLANYSYDITKQLFDFKSKIEQTILQKKPIEHITITVTQKDPQRVITTTLKPISEQSELYATFSKQVQFIQTTIAHDEYQDTWYSLQYIPKLNKTEPKAKT